MSRFGVKTVFQAHYLVEYRRFTLFSVRGKVAYAHKLKPVGTFRVLQKTLAEAVYFRSAVAVEALGKIRFSGFGRVEQRFEPISLDRHAVCGVYPLYNALDLHTAFVASALAVVYDGGEHGFYRAVAIVFHSVAMYDIRAFESYVPVGFQPVILGRRIAFKVAAVYVQLV